jgi:hypothetical protein
MEIIYYNCFWLNNFLVLSIDLIIFVKHVLR